MEAKRSNGNENLEDGHFFRWTFFVEHRSENGDVGNLKKKKKRKFDNPSFVYFESYGSESEKIDKFGKVIGISNLIFFHDEIEKTCKKVRIVNLVQISGN